jgi:hypothetical protein
MRSWDVPVAEPGGLIVVEAEMDPYLGFAGAERVCEFNVARSVIGRVTVQDDEGVDAAGLDIAREFADRSGLTAGN